MQIVTKGFARGRRLSTKTWRRKRSRELKKAAHRAYRRTGKFSPATEYSSS